MLTTLKVYLWVIGIFLITGIFIAPPQMELEQKKHNADLTALVQSLQSQSAVAATKEATRRELGNLLLAGDSLLVETADLRKPDPTRKAQAWFDRTRQFLRLSLGQVYEARFIDTSDVLPHTIPVTGMPPGRARTWEGVQGRLQKLQQFLRELS